MTAAVQPIPIAFCITELDRGGAERAFTRLILGLDRTKWLPRVFGLGPHGYFADLLTAGNVSVECFGARGMASFPRLLWQLTGSLRSFRPRLLQSFLFHGNIAGRIAGRMAGVPVIVSGIRVAERRSPWYGRLDRWTNGLVNHNVCVSQGVADFAIHETKLRAGKISLIPNGVDFPLFRDASAADRSLLALRPADPVVITVGRLEPQKGIVHFLDAAAIVLGKVPNCQFLIVGDGPDRASLEASAMERGIASSVTFTGPRSDVPALLKASDLFVLASLWEGMPNALLEAMAACLPVVATAVEGSREIVSSDVNGLLVEPRNATDLANAIIRLWNSPDDRTRFSAAAQQTISKDFTDESSVTAYERLYSRLLNL